MPRQRHPRCPSLCPGGVDLWPPGNPYLSRGRSGSPDTSKGEDEFSFSAVRLPTPLILRVQMMNFFLSLSPPPLFFFLCLSSFLQLLQLKKPLEVTEIVLL